MITSLWVSNVMPDVAEEADLKFKLSLLYGKIDVGVASPIFLKEIADLNYLFH